MFHRYQWRIKNFEDSEGVNPKMERLSIIWPNYFAPELHETKEIGP